MFRPPSREKTAREKESFLLLSRACALYSTYKRQRKAPRSPSILNNLPSEILYLISDDLPISSRFLLRQTSHRFWAILSKRCIDEISALTFDERRAFLAEIIKHDKRKCICQTCHHIHPIKELDKCRRSLRAGFDFRNRMIEQMRLKLLRGDESCITEDDELRVLLRMAREEQKHEIVTKESLSWCCFGIAHDRVYQSHFERFRLIDDKWFSFSCWTIESVLPFLDTETVPYTRICAHLHLWKHMFMAETTNELFTQVMDLLASKDETWSDYSCSKCPTDYAVAVSSNEISIRAWKALDGDDMSIEYHTQTVFDSIKGREMYGPVINHVPGSTRRLIEDLCEK